MIEEHHKTCLDVLGEGYNLGKLILLECKEAATNEPVVIVCAYEKDTGNSDDRLLYPVARLFKDDPMDEITPPEGFQMSH